MSVAVQDHDKTVFARTMDYSDAIRPISALWTFQSAMNIILSSMKHQLALVSLDHNVIFSMSPYKHDRSRTAGLDDIEGLWLTLNVKKCNSFSNPIDYLGHIINPGWLLVSSHITDGLAVYKSQLLLRICALLSAWLMSPSGLYQVLLGLRSLSTKTAKGQVLRLHGTVH